MNSSTPADSPLQIVTACKARHLHILELAVKNLRKFASAGRIYVITAKENFPVLKNTLGDSQVTLLDEDTVIPTMTLASLRQLPIPCFPRGAGWYFQQLLKLGFALHPEAESRFLIWDADTVLLRPLEFFDSEGRLLFTKAEEHHQPYFDNYAHLLGQDPNREFSFISQHIPVDRAMLCEMLGLIEKRFEGDENWAWKLMKNLVGDDSNLFSEFETYGHFVKNNHLNRAVFRSLPWTREGTTLASFAPKATDLERLAEKFFFAAFERPANPWVRAWAEIRHRIRRRLI